MPIQGAEALHNGKASDLAGFHEESDHDFSITLSQPYAAFLACLSTPGASVLDEESTVEAGDRFGRDPEYTIGTGPFIFRRWNRGVDVVGAQGRNSREDNTRDTEEQRSLDRYLAGYSDKVEALFQSVANHTNGALAFYYRSCSASSPSFCSSV